MKTTTKVIIALIAFLAIVISFVALSYFGYINLIWMPLIVGIISIIFCIIFTVINSRGEHK